MLPKSDFNDMWRRHEFTVSHAGDSLCEYAVAFEEWLVPVIANVEHVYTVVAVNQGIVLVARKYMEWYELVPKSHRNQVGERRHICIFQCFRAAMMKLRVIELRIQPPPISVPPPPLPPPPPPAPQPLQIAGIFLGEDD